MGRWRLGPAWGARTSNGSRPCTYSAARRISAAAASSRFSDAFARASAIFASETTRCAMPLALSESCRSMLCSETVAARDRVGTAAASSAARSWRPVSSSAETCTGITMNGTFFALSSACRAVLSAQTFTGFTMNGTCFASSSACRAVLSAQTSTGFTMNGTCFASSSSSRAVLSAETSTGFWYGSTLTGTFAASRRGSATAGAARRAAPGSVLSLRPSSSKCAASPFGGGGAFGAGAGASSRLPCCAAGAPSPAAAGGSA